MCPQRKLAKMDSFTSQHLPVPPNSWSADRQLNQANFHYSLYWAVALKLISTSPLLVKAVQQQRTLYMKNYVSVISLHAFRSEEYFDQTIWRQIRTFTLKRTFEILKEEEVSTYNCYTLDTFPYGWATDWAAVVRYFPPQRPDRAGVYPTSFVMRTGGMGPGREANHFPSSYEVKNNEAITPLWPSWRSA